MVCSRSAVATPIRPCEPPARKISRLVRSPARNQKQFFKCRDHHSGWRKSCPLCSGQNGCGVASRRTTRQFGSTIAFSRPAHLKRQRRRKRRHGPIHHRGDCARVDIVFGKSRICHPRERRWAATGRERRSHHQLLQEGGVDRSSDEGAFGLGRTPCRSLRAQRRITLDSSDQRDACGRAAFPTKPARRCSGPSTGSWPLPRRNSEEASRRM